MQPTRVLLIESCEYDANVTLSLLRRIGAEARRVATAEQAEKELGNWNFDCLLLSIKSGTAAAIQALQQIKSLRSGIAIIIVTDTHDQEFFLEAIDLDTDDYLIKGDFDEALLNRSLLFARQRRRRMNQLRDRVEYLQTLVDRSNTHELAERDQVDS